MCRLGAGLTAVRLNAGDDAATVDEHDVNRRLSQVGLGEVIFASDLAGLALR
jgi:hypothetical protein